ncbi:MAG: RNA-binding S4 domain-containing protein [Chitinophagales bacterium]
MIQKLRIDKWLWAVRIFKTRTAASKACDAGKVKVKDDKVKASYKIAVGDMINVRVNYVNRIVKVEKIIEKRVGAAIAVECYEDLTPDELKPERLKSAFLQPTAYRERGQGRPTKKERRTIDKFTTDFED